MKKLFIVSLILLIAVLFFLGIYNIAFKKDSTNETLVRPVVSQNVVKNEQPQKNEVTEQQQPMSKQGLISNVLDKKIISASLDKKNASILFFLPDGSILKTDEDGNNQQSIASINLAGINDIQWSPDKGKLIIRTTKNNQSSFIEYEFKTQNPITLKSGLDSAVWDNLGTKIFYKFYDAKTKTRTLNISNTDGTNWQKLTEITARNLSIAQVPLTSTVSFWNSPTSSEQTTLQTIGAFGGDQKTLFSGKYGADYLWAPNGSQALVSFLDSANSNNLRVGLISSEGSFKDLNFSTFVSKCVWSNDSQVIYCAKPNVIPSGYNIPDDYIGGKLSTSDTFWKIDLASGKQTQISNPAQANASFDATNLFLSSSEDLLYFINRVDQKLYKLSL